MVAADSRTPDTSAQVNAALRTCFMAVLLWKRLEILSGWDAESMPEVPSGRGVMTPPWDAEYREELAP
jgi:hypothetical protein